MDNSKQIEALRQKLTDFVIANTPKKARYATGLAWTLWEKFRLSKDESEIFIADKSIHDYFTTKCGTWQSYHTLVLGSVSANPELSGHILCSTSDSHLYKFKVHIISMGLYKAPLPSAELLDDPDAIIAHIKIMAPSDAITFISNNNERIRLEAYNRAGILACAEQMAKDKSAKIRELICNHLPCGDKALKIMMNDRSKWVFRSVLRKIDKEHIPMMLGSKHLKDKMISDILNRRMSND